MLIRRIWFIQQAYFAYTLRSLAEHGNEQNPIGALLDSGVSAGINCVLSWVVSPSPAEPNWSAKYE